MSIIFYCVLGIAFFVLRIAVTNINSHIHTQIHTHHPLYVLGRRRLHVCVCVCGKPHGPIRLLGKSWIKMFQLNVNYMTLFNFELIEVSLDVLYISQSKPHTTLHQCVRLIIGRSWVQSLAASYQKTLKGGSCCYPVWRSTFERDRATSIWRCSVAAGPTINWAKRFSISDNKIIILADFFYFRARHRGIWIPGPPFSQILDPPLL